MVDNNRFRLTERSTDSHVSKAMLETDRPRICVVISTVRVERPELHPTLTHLFGRRVPEAADVGASLSRNPSQGVEVAKF